MLDLTSGQVSALHLKPQPPSLPKWSAKCRKRRKKQLRGARKTRGRRIVMIVRSAATRPSAINMSPTSSKRRKIRWIKANSSKIKTSQVSWMRAQSATKPHLIHNRTHLRFKLRGRKITHGKQLAFWTCKMHESNLVGKPTISANQINRCTQICTISTLHMRDSSQPIRKTPISTSPCIATWKRTGRAICIPTTVGKTHSISGRMRRFQSITSIRLSIAEMALMNRCKWSWTRVV